MGKQLNTKDFIDRANKKHNNKYDYSPTHYVNVNTKVKIRCNIHGEFEQNPYSHAIMGQGCIACSGRKKLTTEEFIKRAKETHGNRYNYSLTEYVNIDSSVKIICNKHGTFEQSPYAHTAMKHGCSACSKNRRLSTEIFIERANKIHCDTYDYSSVKYKNKHNKITILCKKHGAFKQSPNSHLKGSGCAKCVNKAKLTTEEFITLSKKAHGNKYNYSESIYTNGKNNIKIICSIHGVFTQRASHHMGGHGCQKCIESNGEKLIEKFLLKNNIVHIREKTFDFYLPTLNMCIEYDGIQHFIPIEFFGGVQAFKQLKKTDEIKTKYCRKSKMILLRIKYTENVEDKLNQVFSDAIS